MKMVHIGHGHYIKAEKIVAVYRINDTRQRFLKNIIEKARTGGKLQEADNGKKAKSVITLAGGVVVLTSLSSKTIQKRIMAQGEDPEMDDEEDA